MAVRQARKPEDLTRFLDALYEESRALGGLHITTPTGELTQIGDRFPTWRLGEIINATEIRLGVPDDGLGRIFEGDALEMITTRIEGLRASPTEDAIRGAFRELRAEFEHSLQQGHLRTLPGRIEDYIAQAQGRGPLAALDIYGQIAQDVYEQTLGHMQHMDEMWRALDDIVDPAFRQIAYAEYQAQRTASWARVWDKQAGAIKAIRTGLERAGHRVPDNFLDSFTALKTQTEAFYKLHTKEWAQYFKNAPDLTVAERLAAREAVYSTLDDAYLRLTYERASTMERMDDALLGLFPDRNEAQITALMEVRSNIRELHAADAGEVMRFQPTVRGLPREQANQAWAHFNQQRLKTGVG